jgi:hypothetical protein
MHGAHVESQKINPGVTEHIKAQNIPLIFLQQKNLSLQYSAGVNKLKTLRTAMVHMPTYKWT